MAWWERANPGDKVVCIDDNWDYVLDECGAPVCGQVYVIQVMEVPPAWVNLYKGCPVFFGFSEFGRERFSAACFRPVEHDRTASGMETIRKILDTVPATSPELEDA